MKNDTQDDEILKQYLLGALNEEQTDELERRLLAEEELFELAEAVEGDLLLAAVRGDLSSAERGRVLRRANASPEGRARLALIRELVSHGLEQVPVPPAKIPFPEWQWVHATALAACLAVFVAGSVWLSTQTAMPRSANMIARGLPAEPAHQEPKPGPVAPPADQIAVHPPAPVPPAPPVPDREPSVRPKLASVVLHLALSTVRSEGARTRLEIPAGTGQVEIRLRVDREEPYATFSAILQNAATGEEILREERIAARDVEGLRAIVLSVPSTELEPGFYQVEVHGIAPEGDELLGRPLFEVVST